MDLANITLQVPIIMVLLTLIIYQSASPYRYTRINQAFLMTLILNASFMTLDVFSWLFDGTPGTVARTLLWWDSFLEYILCIVMFFALITYILLSLPLSERHKDNIIKTTIHITGIYLLLFTIFQSHGFIFVFNEINRFEFGPYYWVHYALVIILLLTLAIIVVL